MTAEEKSRYFQELTLDLQHEGFTAGVEADGLLPVDLDGQHLRRVTADGEVRYLKEDVAGDGRSAALGRTIDIARTTAEYMSQMEATPQLTASGLTADRVGFPGPGLHQEAARKIFCLQAFPEGFFVCVEGYC